MRTSQPQQAAVETSSPHNRKRRVKTDQPSSSSNSKRARAGVVVVSDDEDEDMGDEEEVEIDDDGAASMGREGCDLIGQRVRVYWDADNAWYAGTIRGYTRSRGHLIVYDSVVGEDDLRQWCKLEEEVWQIIGSMPLDAYV